MLCLHCKRNRAGRARGLCYGCYEQPEVLALYPSQHTLSCPCGKRLSSDPGARRSGRCSYCRGRMKVPDRVVEAEKLLPTIGTGPSSAAPQNAERLAVLIARSEAGVPLWDKRDRWEDDEA